MRRQLRRVPATGRPRPGPVVLTVAVLAGLLSLISMPVAAAASSNGSYSGPIELRSGAQPGQLVLDRIDVTEQQATVHLRLVNTMPEKMLMTCPAAGKDEQIRILRPQGEDVRPSRSYCTERAGMRWAVKVGTSLPLTVTFPAQGWEDGTFGLYWYGYSAGAMELRAGQIVAVAPPPGSRLGDLREPWVRFRDQIGVAGLLLGLVLLMLVAAGLRRWYVHAAVPGADEPDRYSGSYPDRENAPELEDDRGLEAGQAWQARHRPRSAGPDSRPDASGAKVIGFPPHGRRRRDDRR